jgi:Fe2+ transport system protein FeoA
MAQITCAMCGTRYDSGGHAACKNCPLHANCSLTCCPACGYTGVDPDGSSLVRLFRPLWRRRRWARKGARWRSPPGAGGWHLDQVEPGEKALVAGLNALPPERRRRLEGLGLSCGQTVEVLAQSPVTIVRLGHAQLALAAELSRLIAVDILGEPLAAEASISRPEL